VDGVGKSKLLPKWLIAICVCACLVFAEGLHATEHKQVLIIHSVGREFRPWNEYAKHVRAELDRQSLWPLDVREHSLESARSSDINPEPAFVAYLQNLHAGHAPDLIVAIGAPAANFIQRHRQQLFPTAPALFTAIEQRRIDYSSLTGNDAVVAVRHNFRALFESFLRISPDTKIVGVVIGSSPNELFWRDEMQRELKQLETRIEIRFYDQFSLEDILKQTVTLPPHSAIFWNQMAVDGAGVAHEGDIALTRIYATANAPIFTHDDAFFGDEIIGGPMHSALAGSRTAAAVAIRILNGEKAGDIKTPPADYATPKYNWRELRRWGISESRLPPESQIYFREQPVWEKYRWQIALVWAVVLMQAGLIFGLLLEHRRRHHFQVQASRSSAELAHVNRYSTAGELTASISHELNQPLGAILANAEAAESLLKSSTPNLDELREIVTDIRRDDLRASEVIQRLRGMLSKAPAEMRNVDLNEIVRDTILLLSPLAIARKVEVNETILRAPLPIRGDRVLLQQAIVNLIVNAMDALDALSGVPRAERKVTISTARNDSFAELSVSDAGPGIDFDKLKEVFEPFFTTKPKGMGMGLSIARTIIEAHNGLIWAENRMSDAGAVFYVRLPLVTAPN
jgi:signal transduction histidine kinase